jgi:rhomboid protease GluP
MSNPFRDEEFKPTVTITLLTANLLIWILTVIAGGWDQARTALVEGPGSSLLILFGANNYDFVFRQHEYWRLISYGFLHIGLLHILFNSYALVLYGPVLEDYMGKGRFLLLYIVSAIGGAAISSHFSPAGVSAGASGAIFGMVGALWSVMKRRGASPAAMQQLIGIVAINFMIGLSPGSHVDNWAHGGGLITGLALGFLLPGRNQIRARFSKTLDAVAGCIALGLIAYGLGSAGENVYFHLYHPEKAPLESKASTSGTFTLGVPADWTHASDSGWDYWFGPEKLILFAREVSLDEQYEASTLDGAARLSRRYASAQFPEQQVKETSVTVRERKVINGSPTYRIQVYVSFKEGGESVRWISYWLHAKNRTYVVTMMTPSELTWPDTLLERIAASLKP